MKKTVILAIVCAVLCAGCNKTVADVLESLGVGGASQTEAEARPALKLDSETRYYNDFLGVSYAVPKNWWLYDVDGDNFGESKGDISDEVSMNVEYNEFKDYSYNYVYLASFGNLENSEQDNHLGFHLEAQSLEGKGGMEEYMRYFEAYMLEPTEDRDYSLRESQQVTINGKSFELREYLITGDEIDDNYIMTLSCEVKRGYVLNIAADYWPENTRAKDAIIESVSKSLELY
jgi:hypothetical protein